MDTPFLSIIIPTYNEEQRIDATMKEVMGYLKEQLYTWEVVIVDDGSVDNTLAIAARWAQEDERVRVESVRHGGKGWAVKRGMLAACGNYRFMCDADLAMPIRFLGAFVDRMAEGYDIVIGSRQTVGARRFGEPWGRHVMGRVFNQVVRLLAVGDFQDTQCGFKCFRGTVAEELFTLQKTSGFGFDVEILYIGMKKRLRVLEMPIDWYHQSSSKVRPFVDSYLMLKDTVLLRLRSLRGAYNP